MKQVPSANPIYRCHGKTRNLLYLTMAWIRTPSRDSCHVTGLKVGPFTADRQCRIFVNFIDHMKLVITQPGGDIQKVFRQYSKLLSAIEGCLTRKGNKFMWSWKYGFFTSSPHDVGTGLEVQVKARFPTLIKVKTMFKKTLVPKVLYSNIRKEDKRPGNGVSCK